MIICQQGCVEKKKSVGYLEKRKRKRRFKPEQHAATSSLLSLGCNYMPLHQPCQLPGNY